MQQDKQSQMVVNNSQFFTFVKTDLNDLKNTVVEIWEEGLQSIHQQGEFTTEQLFVYLITYNKYYILCEQEHF